MGKDRYGCAGRRSIGTCANDRMVTHQEIEARVLTGLKTRLLASELVLAFVDAFRSKAEAQRADRAAQHQQRAKDLAAVERKIAGLKAVEDGMYHSSMKGRLAGAGGGTRAHAGRR